MSRRHPEPVVECATQLPGHVIVGRTLIDSEREGRSCYCLRLGFFGDAISAKQVAYFVRSSFASVAVLPVTERERALAKDTAVASASLGDPFQESLDQTLTADQKRSATPPNGSAPPRVATQPAAGRSASHQQMPPAKSPSTTDRPRRPARGPGNTLEETLDMLATSELWANEDSLSETGVRHLTVQVQKAKTRRS